MVADDWTIEELLCICISRQIENGDVVVQGLATPVVAAGYLLAWKTHAPELWFASAIGQTMCVEGAPLRLTKVEELWLDKSLSVFGFVGGVADLMPSVNPKEFFRPGQVDAFGNFNNIAIGRDYQRPRLRLPGVGGIPDVTNYLENVYLYVPRHSRATFVSELSFRSGRGHSPHRSKGAGPRYLVSDLGVFDFDAGQLRLRSLHPGVGLSRIKAKTGFEFRTADPLTETPIPTEEELRILRDEVDPLGIRSLEFLTGPQRREKLETIVQLEGSTKG